MKSRWNTTDLRLIWKPEGPAITYDGEFLHVEDLNPHIKTKWRMSRWEMFIFGCKAICGSLAKAGRSA